ncbi:MAG: hypothetical protein ACYDH9_02520 [Limisphaerales bacterium]
MDSESGKNERRILRVIQACVALSVGLMFAFLASVREVNPAIRFEFSTGSLAGFGVGAGLSWIAWQLIFLTRHPTRLRVFGLIVFSALLVLATLCAFGYAVKDVSPERLKDLALGAGLAACFLGVLGLLFWRVTRSLERDTERGAEARDSKQTPE